MVYAYFTGHVCYRKIQDNVIENGITRCLLSRLSINKISSKMSIKTVIENQGPICKYQNEKAGRLNGSKKFKKWMEQ